jgi:hypothetical protein
VGHGEDHREHDHEAGVEEDREAEDQRGQAQRERSTLFTEDADQVVGQDFRAATGFHDPAEHGAQADEERHGSEGRPETEDEHRHHLVGGDPGGEGGGEADYDQRKQRVHAQPDDQEQQDGDCCRRDEQQGACAQRLSPSFDGHGSPLKQVYEVGESRRV